LSCYLSKDIYSIFSKQNNTLIKTREIMVTFNDALNLIQRAEESIAANVDDSYSEILGGLVGSFKQQLSEDLGLPIDFFEPVVAGEPIEIEEVPIELKAETETPENPELSSEAKKLYDDISIGMGAWTF